MSNLKVLFGLILIFMLGITTWASFDKNIFQGFVAVWSEPWGLATLADAYCGFLTFYAWVFYKETGWGARVGWLVAILALGNIAMAFYMLKILFGLPVNARAEDVLLRTTA